MWRFTLNSARTTYRAPLAELRGASLVYQASPTYRRAQLRRLWATLRAWGFITGCAMCGLLVLAQAGWI